MSILNENITRIKSVMGLVNEQDESKDQMNVNLKKVVEILNFLKIYNNKMEKMLIDISSFAKDQIIDFGLLERGLRKRLLKKGDKKKNVEEYFGKVLNSSYAIINGL